MRPSDAIHLRAWRVRRDDEARRLREGIDEAKRLEAAAAAEVEVARESLANAQREREALEKHFGRWSDTQRRRAEAKAEAEDEDRRPR